MTVHEPEIQKLAKSTLGGQRFELFIRRWEMNNEPLPPESKSEMYVIIHGSVFITHCSNRPDGRGWSSHGRALDLAEEDYFNADDDEEELLPAIGQQWLRGSGATSPLSANNTGMKRKRRIGMSTQTKGYRPPLRTPRLSALVDYEEDDEEYSSNDQPATSISGANPRSMPDSNRLPGSQPSQTPTTNITTPTSLSPGPQPKYEDDDNLLEALARPRVRPPSPAPTGPSIGLMRASEKRRRTDDDDELFERLSKSSKKPGQKETFTIRPKNGDDPPVAKKIKVKLGAVGLAVASSPSTPTMPTPTPGALTALATRVDDATPSSEAGLKDGDIG
jgi:protein phosphatase-4 regulatory subunit 3